MSNIIQRSIKGSALTHAEVDANFNRRVSGETVNYTVLKSDNEDTLEFNGSSLTCALPSVAVITSTSTGSETGEFTTTIKNIHSTTLTLTPDGLDKIDGVNSSTTLLQNQSITLQTNNATDGWNILSNTNLMSSTKLTAAASSISIGSLSFAADTPIEVTALIIAGAAIVVPHIVINNDVINTNYWSSYIVDNGAPTKANNPQLTVIATGDSCAFNIKLIPDTTNGRTFVISNATYYVSATSDKLITSNIVYTISGAVTSVGIRESTGGNFIIAGSTLSVK